MNRKPSIPANKSRAKVVDNKVKEKEPVRPHVKASLEDINWLRSQPPCVQQLWLDCVAVEQYGCQQRKLESSLSDKFFKRAKMALEKQGLFSFEPIAVVSTAGRLKITGWKVENLHGYYIKNYWEISPSPRQNDEPSGQNDEPSGQNDEPSGQNVSLIETNCHDVAPENRAMTDAAENQPRFNQSLTTPQPPPKGVEEGSRCISQETQQTPLGGAAATSGEMQEEEKEEEKDAPDTFTASVEDKPEVNGTPTDLGEDRSSGGGSIASQPNSDVIDTVDGDRESDEVGHSDIVATICVRVQEHYYYPTSEQKQVMMQLTLEKLERLSKLFQTQMNQRGQSGFSPTGV